MTLKWLFIIPFTLIFLVSCDINNATKEKFGEIVWSHEHEFRNSGGLQPYIDDDRVFLMQDGDLRAYRLKDGELLWSQSILSYNRTRIYSFNLLADENHVYIDIGFDFRAYNKETGNLSWKTEFTSDGFQFAGLGGAQISQNDHYLFLPRQGRVLQVRKNNGTITRQFLLDRLIPEGLKQGATNPTPSPFGDNVLYVPTVYLDTVNEPEMRKGNLFAYDLDSGELLWEFKGPKKVLPTEEFKSTDSLMVSSPIREIKISEDYVVVASNPTIMLIDRFTGELIWHIPLKDRRFTANPGEENSFDGVSLGLDIDPTGIYIATLGGTARKLDWETGSELWSVNVIYSVTAQISVYKDNLYFNNNGGGGIWVIDKVSGDVLFNSNPPGFQTDINDVYLSPLAVDNGYMVNTGALRVYALTAFD